MNKKVKLLLYVLLYLATTFAGIVFVSYSRQIYLLPEEKLNLKLAIGLFALAALLIAVLVINTIALAKKNKEETSEAEESETEDVAIESEPELSLEEREAKEMALDITTVVEADTDLSTVKMHCDNIVEAATYEVDVVNEEPIEYVVNEEKDDATGSEVFDAIVMDEETEEEKDSEIDLIAAEVASLSEEPFELLERQPGEELPDTTTLLALKAINENSDQESSVETSEQLNEEVTEEVIEDKQEPVETNEDSSEEKAKEESEEETSYLTMSSPKVDIKLDLEKTMPQFIIDEEKDFIPRDEIGLTTGHVIEDKLPFEEKEYTGNLVDLNATVDMDIPTAVIEEATVEQETADEEAVEQKTKDELSQRQIDYINSSDESYINDSGLPQLRITNGLNKKEVKQLEEEVKKAKVIEKQQEIDYQQEDEQEDKLDRVVERLEVIIIFEVLAIFAIGLYYIYRRFFG